VLNEAYLANLRDLRSGTGDRPGFVVVSASEPNIPSHAGIPWDGHGAFTYHLLDGLRGAADDDRDSIVTLGEAMEDAREAVRLDTDNAQVPMISLTYYDRFLPLSIVSGG